MKFSEMPYQRVDDKKLSGKLDELARQFRAAESAEGQRRLIGQVQELTVGYVTMAEIAAIRNTIDTRNAFYEAERAFYDAAGPVLEDKFRAFRKEMAQSAFLPLLKEKYGGLLFKNISLELRGYSPGIIPLVQEENELCTQYQKLYAAARVLFDGKTCTIAQLEPYKQSTGRETRRAAYAAEGGYFDEHQQELDGLFDKLVKNRTKQARALGYDSFVELGYVRRMRNCYGPAEVAAFRRQVVRDVVPLAWDIMERRSQRIGVDHLKFYDSALAFGDGNPQPEGTPAELLEAGKRMYSEMSPETAGFIQTMFDMELFDVVAKDGKAPGGYCTGLPAYHCPFIFSNFNGTSGDVDVLTHEAGHAFADMVAEREIELYDLRQPTMDGCETHSMSMEFLTAPWHHLFFGAQTDKYALSHAEAAFTFLPYGCQVDHFQELVYSSPDMSPAERNAAWAHLDQEYRPYLDFGDMPFYGRGAGWQRQLHIYQAPFYYIDYCMAQAVALQLWTLSREDRPGAWGKYMALIRQGGTATFDALVRSIGLRSPLEKGCLRETCQASRAWLEAFQA